MKTGWLPVGLFAVFALVAAVGLGRAAPLPVLDDKPLLQVDPGGPSAAVTALAFSPDGKTLYSAGLDKLVRVWRLREGVFVLEKTFRVPIGPGTGGAINALAVSPDGDWLAVAGRAPMRGETGFQQSGVIVEAAALRPEQLEDAGLIYLLHTTGPAPGKVLRGHRGEVRELAFAPARAGKPPLLVSAATEREGQRGATAACACGTWRPANCLPSATTCRPAWSRLPAWPSGTPGRNQSRSASPSPGPRRGIRTRFACASGTRCLVRPSRWNAGRPTATRGRWPG